MIRQERTKGGAGRSRFLAALAVLACGFVVAGCGGEPLGALLKGPAQKMVAQQAKVVLPPALNRFSARSVLLVGTEARAGIIARSEPEAAAAVKQREPLERAAQESAADVDAIAGKTTTKARGRAKVKACAKAGTLTAAQKYVKEYAKQYVQDKPPPDAQATMVQSTMVSSISSCVGKVFPDHAPTAKLVGVALTRAMLAPSDDLSQTDATAQDYADWLVYSATLSEQAYVATAATDTTVNVSPVAASVDDVLVALLHAHYGRLAVRREDWPTAIDLRKKVLRELAALDVAPELRRSRELLIQSMRTSLASDRKHDACGHCAAPLDRLATAQKRAFVREFHVEFAKRYEGTIEHTDF